MKMKFSRARIFVPEFNGNKNLLVDEQLRFEITPLKIGEFFDVQEVMQGFFEGGKPKPADQVSAETQRKAVALVQQIVPEHVKSIGAPLVDADDKEISVEAICAEAALIALSQELLGEIYAASAPSEDDIKN